MNIHDEIARVAYDLYLKRGKVNGHDLEDWLEAERIVTARHAGTTGREIGPEMTAKKRRGRPPKEKGAEPERKTSMKRARTTRRTRKKKI